MTMHDELRVLRDDLRRRGKNNLALQMAHRETASRLDAILAEYADVFNEARACLTYEYMQEHDEMELCDKYEDLLRQLVGEIIQAAAKAEEE